MNNNNNGDFGLSPAMVLADYNDCIMVGNKDLEYITSDLQTAYQKAEAAVQEFLASEPAARKAVEDAKEAIRKQREAEAAKKKKSGDIVVI